MSHVAAQRLTNVLLAGSSYDDPAEVVRRLGAVQSQDVSPARWSVGQRLAVPVTEDDVQAACDAGRILRTHVLRPTWHFVHPADLDWLQRLTASRVLAACATYFTKADLTPAVLSRCDAILHDALSGGQHLTRAEIGELLSLSSNPLAYVLMHAELELLVCSGVQRGKQQTYALVSDRTPPAPPFDRSAALVELVTRYVTSHGPVTAKDLRWWSSLTLADIRLGLADAGLPSFELDGVTYWHSPGVEPAPAPGYRLLQTFDEYVFGVSESRHAFDDARLADRLPPDVLLRSGLVLLGDQVAGTWRRSVTAGEVVVTAQLFSSPAEEALQVAADELGAFLQRPARVAWSLV